VLNDVKAEAAERMEKSLEALVHNFNKIRTGRAHPSLLDGLKVEYYGSSTPLSQVANVNVEDARTLTLTVWDKSMIQDVERAIMKSNLGLNPSTAGEVMRIPMPMLTEETRKGFTRQAKSEAESARVSVRNARRDAMGMLKELGRDKEISEDDERRGQDEIQKLTDSFIARVEKLLAEKEADLLEI
jgi:ribosome recycling factor